MRQQWKGLLAGACLVAACGERSQGPPESVPASKNSVDPTLVRDSTSDLSFIDRFDLELLVSGEPVPGRLIDVTLNVHANLNTVGASIELYAPEVAAMELEGNSGKVPTDSKLKTIHESRRSFAEGEAASHKATIRFRGSGYYRVVAVVSADPSEQLAGEPLAVQDLAVREFWLYVNGNRGKLTRNFDPSAFAPDELEMPGPRRDKLGRTDPSLEVDEQPLQRGGRGAGIALYNVMPPCSTWRVVALIQGAYAVIRSASIKAQSGFSIVQTTSDANGAFQLCLPLTSAYTATVDLVTPDVKMVGGPFATITGVTQGTVGSDIAVSGSHAQVFLNFLATIPSSRAILGHSRVQIPVGIPAGEQSYYSPSQDKIYIGDLDVWGQDGIFVVAHEYGHAVHEKALGPNPQTCPSAHYINGAHTMPCAYGEGFADFHAAITRGAALFGDLGADDHIELNDYHPGLNYSTGQPSNDGSVIEGAVAAFLYDLVDGPNELDSPSNTANGDDDTVQFPGRYVADIYRTCEVRFSAGFPPSYYWVGENAIDYVVYCMERNIDPAILSSSVYFPTRGFSQDPSAQREGATEPPSWSAPSIRALWLRNLYDQ